jgi:hypothetical protein
MLSKQVSDRITPSYKLSYDKSFIRLINLVLNVATPHQREPGYDIKTEAQKSFAIIASLMRHHQTLGSRYEEPS